LAEVFNLKRILQDRDHLNHHKDQLVGIEKFIATGETFAQTGATVRGRFWTMMAE